jgi:hypothetical protein
MCLSLLLWLPLWWLHRQSQGPESLFRLQLQLLLWLFHLCR